MHDQDPIDFAMFDLPTRPGPCRKAAAEETDATAARLAREVETAPFIIESRLKWEQRALTPEAQMKESTKRGAAIKRGEDMHRAIEVKHGSGKVKV